jgi:hypothetical protein
MIVVMWFVEEGDVKCEKREAGVVVGRMML